MLSAFLLGVLLSVDLQDFMEELDEMDEMDGWLVW